MMDTATTLRPNTHVKKAAEQLRQLGIENNTVYTLDPNLSYGDILELRKEAKEMILTLNRIILLTKKETHTTATMYGIPMDVDK